MRLIGRLAADWQEAEKALEAEQERQRSLQMKIDGLSLRKQQHFPAPVERGNINILQSSVKDTLNTVLIQFPRNSTSVSINITYRLKYLHL